MPRWVFLLLIVPLCLVLNHFRPQAEESRKGQPGNEEKVAATPVIHLEGTSLHRQNVLAAMAVAPGQGFPGGLPWAPLHEVGKNGLYPIESLLHYHPVAFLEMCLEKYQREVKGYTCTFHKQELVKGKMQKLEILKCAFREEPFSVFMEWLEGGKLAKRVLYVKGENNDKLLARPFITFLPVTTRDVDGPDATNTSRFPITEFGMYKGMTSSVNAMRRAEARGTLHMRYEGLAKVEKAGNRVCHKFIRTPYTPPEDKENLNELTIYVDRDTWLQVGSILKDTEGQLIAEYFFRDIQINPEFKTDQFTSKGL